MKLSYFEVDAFTNRRFSGNPAGVCPLGERVGEVRDAVQPGRRIATLRRSAGLAIPVALMTPSV